MGRVRGWGSSIAAAGCVPALVLALAAPAHADRGFATRFDANANGNIAVAANTLESCPEDASGCAQARMGTGALLDDNDFTMRHVDVDGDPATFDSSSARLELPAGATVLFAGLYDGGRTDAGTRGSRAADATPAALATVDLRVPGESGYTRLGEAGATLDQSTEVKGAYQTVHDVTDLVRRAGAGEYTVADVQSGTGVDRYAGWSLIVAYEAPGDPPRNLTVVDGLQSVTRGRPALTIGVSGFQTPLVGPVRTQLGFVAYEGDLGAGGDSAALDGRSLSDAISAPTNFFNSAISVDGSPFTAKSPDYRNQLGFDAKLIRADGILPNGASTADIALRTTLEQYLPGAVTFATDLYAPDVQATKSVENLSHPGESAHAGDRLRYVITYRNTGAESARDLVATDVLPADVTLLPGSLRVAGATPSEMSDLAGDDLGEYDPQTRTVRFLLGADATPERGGTLAVAPALGSEATVSFEAQVDPAATAHELANVARASFTAPSLGRPLTAASDVARIAVSPTAQPPAEADIAVAEDETDAPTSTGGEVLDAVTVTDRGPDDATGVDTAVTAPPSATIESATTPAGTCTITALGVDCHLAHLDAGGSVQIDLTERVPAPDVSDGAVNEVTATGAQLDVNAADNAARATSPSAPGIPAPAADLRTTVRSDHTHVAVGGAVTDTITVHNAGPGAATGVALDAALSIPARRVAVSAPGLSCDHRAALRCTLARLASGRSVSVRVTSRPRRAGRLLESVSASSDRVDPRPANDVGHAATTVVPARARLRLSERVGPRAVHPGDTLTVALRAASTTATPARRVATCLSLPAGLRVLAPRGGHVDGQRICWTAAFLDGHGARRFSTVVRVSPGARPGTQLRLPARLSAANAAARTASAAAEVRARFTACPASRASEPRLGHAAC